MVGVFIDLLLLLRFFLSLFSFPFASFTPLLVNSRHSDEEAVIWLRARLGADIDKAPTEKTTNDFVFVS